MAFSVINWIYWLIAINQQTNGHWIVPIGLCILRLLDLACTDFLIDIALVIKIITFRTIERSFLFKFARLVKCLTPIFDLCKPSYHKPIQQQPSNNYSTILYTHICSNEMKIRNHNNARPKVQPNYRQNVSQTCQHICEKRQLHFEKLFKIP